jgi:hypothetical protein
MGRFITAPGNGSLYNGAEAGVKEVRCMWVSPHHPPSRKEELRCDGKLRGWSGGIRCRDDPVRRRPKGQERCEEVAGK